MCLCSMKITGELFWSFPAQQKSINLNGVLEKGCGSRIYQVQMRHVTHLVAYTTTA